MTSRAGGEDAAVNLPAGETLSVPERVIVAPAIGVFHRSDGDGRIHDGDLIGKGDVVGIIRSLGRSTPVPSPFAGSLVAILARDGERVRPGQPVAWLRTAITTASA
jgi:biotin carboxyl carrier protein